jgi:hypothetical protein
MRGIPTHGIEGLALVHRFPMGLRGLHDGAPVIRNEIGGDQVGTIALAPKLSIEKSIFRDLGRRDSPI